MLALLRRIWSDESGQALVEYGLMVGLVALALVAAVALFKDQVVAVWTFITGKLSTALG